MPARLPPRLARACLGVAAILGVLLLALPSTFFAGYDYVNLHVFYKQYLRDGLLSGQAPWWNPYVALGRPFFADLETACCYPPTWLVLPLGVETGVWAIVVLHLALALYGSVRLGRALAVPPAWAWVGALSFAGAGFLSARLQAGQIQVFCSLCWMPAAFWAGARLQERRDRAALAGLAVVLAGWFLAGSPPFLWVGGLGLALWTAARSPSPTAAVDALLRLAGASVLAAAVAAVQLVPWLELLHEGNRPLRSVAYATAQGLEPAAWLSLGLPPSASLAIAREANVDIGLPLAAAALAGLCLCRRSREARAWAVLAVAGLGLAAGAHSPLLPFLAAHVPGFGALRFPARYAVLAAFALLWLGAMTLARVAPGGAPRAAAAALQLACVASGVVVGARHYAPVPPAPWDADVRADLAAHGAFGAEGVPPRIAFDERHVRADSGMVEGYSTLGGFANPHLARVWDAVHAAAGVAAPVFGVHEFDPHVFDHGAFPVPWANLQLGWDARTGRTVWRPEAAADPRAALEGGGRARLVRFARNSLDLEVDSPAGGTLVLSEPWYPGWTATANGDPAPVFLVHGWMRGVTVPAGPSRLHLTYFPQRLWPGAVLSAVALAACALWWKNFDKIPGVWDR